MSVTVVFGSREDSWGNRAEDAIAYIDQLLDDWPPANRIIAGGSPGKGVDYWVEQACRRKGIAFTPFPPQWKPGVKPAVVLFERNEHMALAATQGIGICPRSGITNGSRDMMTRLLRHCKNVDMRFI